LLHLVGIISLLSMMHGTTNINFRVCKMEIICWKSGCFFVFYSINELLNGFFRGAVLRVMGV